MSKRILVVDDQEDLRGVLRNLLIGSGNTVIEAANGEAGVARAKSDRPDLILMDIQMPLIDGYGATRRIKVDPDLKPIPIVAVSSFAMKGDEESARRGVQPLRDQALQPDAAATPNSRSPRRQAVNALGLVFGSASEAPC